MTPIRRATANDAMAIRNLTRECYRKWISVIGREPRPMSADYLKAVQKHWIDLVDRDGALAALIEMIPAENHLLIENLAVAPRYQRQGLGNHLTAHALEAARSAGFSEVRLYTNAAFAENLEYYRRRGFVQTAHEPLPDGGTMVHFTKPVS